LCREDRPWAHRDDDGVALDPLAVDLDTCDPRPTTRNPRDLPETQLGALHLRRPHHRGGELSRMDLSGGFSRAQTSIDTDPGRQPIEAANTGLSAEAHGPAIGGDRAIVPVVGDLLRQPAMQGKAASRERL
jgi:hypothetical protein